MGLQVYILAVWATLFGMLRFGIWLCAAIGLCLITIYRVVEFEGEQSLQNVLAFLISLFFAWAARETRKQMIAQKRIARQLQLEAHRPTPIEPEPITVARELAVVLNGLHGEIEYYEQKADEYDFPRFSMTANAK